MEPNASLVSKPRALLGALAVAVAVAWGAGAAACGHDEGGGANADAGAGESSTEAGPAGSVDGGDAGLVRAEFGLDVRPRNVSCLAPPRPPPSGTVAFRPIDPDVVLTGYRSMAAQPPGDKTRWFASFLDGRITGYPALDPPATPPVVADIGALAGVEIDTRGEGGLLGIAFHPKFAQNGRLYVSFTSKEGALSGMSSHVGYVTSTDGGASFTSYTDLFTFEQPAFNHDGGGLLFGPDGYLYASFGDGGACCDVFGHGQDKSGFFSKIIRIDVDTVPPGKTYGIPADNPFANVPGAEPATWAYGFRNPFRFSFDRATGELWAGDVGQELYEEVDLVKPGGNYGWSCREGFHAYQVDRCPNGPQDSLDPVFEYPHGGSGNAIVGGVVYRGAALPDLVGSYVFGDYQTGAIYALSFDPTTGAAVSRQLNSAGPNVNVGAFVEDADGEIVVVGLDQPLMRLVPPPADAGAPGASKFPDRLSKTGCFDPLDPRTPSPALVPYTVNAPLWSDGADKTRAFALPDGKTITVGADGDLELPTGSVITKTFSLGARRVETRLLVRHDDGEWAGYSYEWLDDQSDAVLLPSSKKKQVGAQSHSFPSRGECMRCHTQAAGRTLGLELGQLNGDFTYTSTNRIANQLRTFEHVGLLSAPLAAPVGQLAAYPAPDGPAPVESRARAYLHANCSMCHRPSGGGRGDFDLRFDRSLAETKACNAEPQTGELGVPGAKVLAPGAPARSHLSLRMHASGASRMPPLATSVVDTAGVAVIDAFIAALAACP